MVRRKKDSAGLPGFVAVDGPLAVGKTVLARHLVRHGARLARVEPTENPFLERALEDPQRHGFSAQMYFLLARHAEQDGLRQGDLFSKRVVACGTFFRDRAFAEAFLPPAELSLYGRIHDELAPRAVTPDLMVLLRASPERILARLRARHRAYEAALDGARVSRICAAFSELAESWRGGALLQVDVGDGDLEERDELLTAVEREIVRASAELSPDERRRVRL